METEPEYTNNNIPKRLTPDRIKKESPEEKICPGCTQPVKKRYHTALWCERCDIVVRLHHACAAPKKLYYQNVKCRGCNGFFDSAFINWAEKESRIRSYKKTWEKLSLHKAERERRYVLNAEGKAACFDCNEPFELNDLRTNPYLTVAVIQQCKECYNKWKGSLKEFEEIEVGQTVEEIKAILKKNNY